jgi:hypothetical protein
MPKSACDLRTPRPLRTSHPRPRLDRCVALEPGVLTVPVELLLQPDHGSMENVEVHPQGTKLSSRPLAFGTKKHVLGFMAAKSMLTEAAIQHPEPPAKWKNPKDDDSDVHRFDRRTTFFQEVINEPGGAPNPFSAGPCPPPASISFASVLLPLAVRAVAPERSRRKEHSRRMAV